jgi:hypothetical protein
MNDKLKPFRDPISKKVLTNQPNYPAGRGVTRKSDEGSSIADKIQDEQARAKPSRQ